MNQVSKLVRPLLFVAAFGACGLLVAVADRSVHAQTPQAPPAARPAPAPLPEGYWPRGKRAGDGFTAPGMRVTDLGKGSRTFKLNFSKGDELMAGLADFATKNKIKNGHFVGLGAIDKGILGWTDTERGNGQKMVPVNEEAEIISFLGSITTNAQGVATVHGHGAVSLQNGSVVGGHIFELHISIIGEVYVSEEEEPVAAAR